MCPSHVMSSLHGQQHCSRSDTVSLSLDGASGRCSLAVPGSPLQATNTCTFIVEVLLVLGQVDPVIYGQQDTIKAPGSYGFGDVCWYISVQGRGGPWVWGAGALCEQGDKQVEGHMHNECD